tara:strand:+ start:3073 stop:4923 length:1851 start_codon:yes stop_codon:yes gene_type:complete
MKHSFDVLVVGGGHAGLESALISAHRGCSTILVTQDPNAIGRMSCNPAIGGLAKGQMVREIDVLGGNMGLFSDFSGIQFKVLNQSKGRSVWSPRAQIDKRVYEKIAKDKVCSTKKITVCAGEVVSVEPKGDSFLGYLRDDTVFLIKTVVVTCGTFLSGKIHIGERKILAGRMGEERSEGITESLKELGLKSGRLKTGTPPRLKANSIDWGLAKKELGDKNPIPFSYQTSNFNPPNIPCFTVKTNILSHNLIKENMERSPMFSGDVSGVGPRYCPSIEDKVSRFKNQNSHLLHLEPEWINSDQIYLNGFSTSLPEEIQLSALKKIPALRNVEFLRPGYAIEYDFFPPAQLKATLESKKIPGLFFAGQINGTSGYEEASAQGLIAGINASSYVLNQDPIVLSRSSSYIGVMIDDLITKDTLEPYRMFTSRAEYRLMLRYSNTFERLSGLAKNHGLLQPSFYNNLKQLHGIKKHVFENLKGSIKPEEIINTTTINQSTPAIKVLKRPEVKIEDLPVRFHQGTERGLEPWLVDEVLKDVEAEIKYEGYIKRHLKEINKVAKNENLKLPECINYSKILGLSNEAKEKLSFVNPETLGQALRVSGITPSDASVLLVNFFRSE